MDLDDEGIGTGYGCGTSHGFYEACNACCMAGVYNHGEVREFVEHGHRSKVEDITCVGVEAADTALAQHHILVTLGKNILGTHQELFESGSKTTLEKMGEFVHIVEGNRENIKITTPFDFVLAKAIVECLTQQPET